MSEHDPKRNLHQRLHAVMGEVDYIQREKKAGMQYKIVSHDAVTAAVRPVLVKHGVIYYPVHMDRTQDGNRTEITLTVRFANIDEPADHIDVLTAGYGIDPQDKGPGKAISYAVKYALLKALGLETGDDPDQDSARHEPRTHIERGMPKPGTKAVDVTRDRHFGNAAEEIKSGQNGTPASARNVVTVQTDPKAWTGSEDAVEFMRRARADLSLIQTFEGLSKWENTYRLELDAIDEHGDAHTGKDGRTRKKYVRDLLDDTYSAIKAHTPNLRAAG